MTHYLVMTWLPPENLEYMLDVLKRQKFNWNIEYAKKEKICICKPVSQVNVRELRVFELDISTPACQEFELWLGEWGFYPIAKDVPPVDKKNIMKEWHGIKKPPLLTRILRYFILKTFYKLMNKIFLRALYPTGIKDTTGTKFPYYDSIYRPFSPITKKFPRTATPIHYMAQPQFNQRNLVLGKMVETPIGSFSDTIKAFQCKKCKLWISQH